VKELPLAVSVAVAVAGLVLVAVLDRWRLGSAVIGLALAVVAAVLRTL